MRLLLRLSLGLAAVFALTACPEAPPVQTVGEGPGPQRPSEEGATGPGATPGGPAGGNPAPADGGPANPPPADAFKVKQTQDQLAGDLVTLSGTMTCDTESAFRILLFPPPPEQGGEPPSEGNMPKPFTGISLDGTGAWTMKAPMGISTVLLAYSDADGDDLPSETAPIFFHNGGKAITTSGDLSDLALDCTQAAPAPSGGKMDGGPPPGGAGEGPPPAGVGEGLPPGGPEGPPLDGAPKGEAPAAGE